MYGVKELWEIQADMNEKMVRTRIDLACVPSVYVVNNNVTENILLIVEFDSIPDFEDAQNQFRGLSIHCLVHSDSAELTFALLDKNLKDIFVLFCENLLKQIDKPFGEKETIREVAEVVYRWKTIFEQLSIQTLSTEQQKGLFGELILIDRLIKAGIDSDRVVQAWQGPLREDKDFVFGNVAVEVKTTASRHPSVVVNNEKQLERGNFDDVILYLALIDSTRDGGLTLPDIVRSITSSLSRKASSDLFKEKLAAAGYNEVDADKYDLQFRLREISVYSVGDDFPSLTRDNICAGIYDLRYSIEISACEKSRIPESTVFDLIL